MKNWRDYVGPAVIEAVECEIRAARAQGYRDACEAVRGFMQAEARAQSAPSRRAPKEFHWNELLTEILGSETKAVGEIRSALAVKCPEIDHGTLRWALMDRCNRGFLVRVRKGLYRLAPSPDGVRQVA